MRCTRKAEKNPEVFKDYIRLQASKIRVVVGYLQDINLSDTDLDSKGRAFETFMGSFFRGDFGQYFTPRPIVKFIVDVLPITHESRVLDTSCGSGGFLLQALDKVRFEADSNYPDQIAIPSQSRPEGAQHFRHWLDFAVKYLIGIEINEQIARTAKMNMIIHDDGHTNVAAADGLLSPDELVRKTGNTQFKASSFDFTSGGNYPAITQTEIGNVLIPAPPIKIQKLIVESIKKIHSEAATLRQQAKQKLDDAKSQVEKLILGSP